MTALRSRSGQLGLVFAFVIGLLGCFGVTSDTWAGGPCHHRLVTVPQEDRFMPFALTIRAGETVEWVNLDTDDHTVVSDDSFNTAGPGGIDQLLPGTDSNGGQPGRFTLLFDKAGTFVYYCRFHAVLDADHQPVAPGPRGGIQGGSPFGTPSNFGTPMSGVITVLDDDGDEGG